MCRAVPQHGSLQGSAVTATVTLVSKACPHPIWLKGPATTTVGMLECRVAPPQHNWLQGMAVTAVGMLVGGAGLWHSLLQDLAVTVVGILLWDLPPSQGQGCMGGAPMPTNAAYQEWQSYAPVGSMCSPD